MEDGHSLPVVDMPQDTEGLEYRLAQLNHYIAVATQNRPNEDQSEIRAQRVAAMHALGQKPLKEDTSYKPPKLPKSVSMPDAEPLPPPPEEVQANVDALERINTHIAVATQNRPNEDQSELRAQRMATMHALGQKPLKEDQPRKPKPLKAAKMPQAELRAENTAVPVTDMEISVKRTVVGLDGRERKPAEVSPLPPRSQVTVERGGGLWTRDRYPWEPEPPSPPPPELAARAVSAVRALRVAIARTYEERDVYFEARSRELRGRATTSEVDKAYAAFKRAMDEQAAAAKEADAAVQASKAANRRYEDAKANAANRTTAEKRTELLRPVQNAPDVVRETRINEELKQSVIKAQKEAEELRVLGRKAIERASEANAEHGHIYAEHVGLNRKRRQVGPRRLMLFAAGAVVVGLLMGRL